MNIKNKNFLVTGAGSGIGKELVLALINKGATVLAVDLREENLKELAKNIGDKNQFFTYIVDISDKKAVEELATKIKADKIELDGLINNAGIIQKFVKVNELDYECINKVMDVNFYGTLYMVKSFLPDLLKRPEAYIVNVSSMGGFLPVPGQSVYGASKAAVKLLTEGLYSELKDTKVNVSIVFPGATKTNISENSGIKMSAPASGKKKSNIKMLPAKKAAEIIISGIEKNKFQIFVGPDCNFMNRLYRFNPTFATNLIAKMMKSLLS